MISKESVRYVSGKSFHICGIQVDKFVFCIGGNQYGETNIPDDMNSSSVYLTTGVTETCAINE